MTDSEIIKALECCTDEKSGYTCNGCPLKDSAFCGGKVMRNALDLINRQKAEIEMLKSSVLRIDNVDLSDDEIAEIRKLPMQIIPCNDEQIKSEARKEED